MKILVDPKYNPDLQGEITSSTALGPGITCAKFLGTLGSRTQFEKLYDESYFGSADRAQIARNLVPHANALVSVLTNPEFSQHRLSVTEGIYEPNPKFVVTEQKAGGKTQAKKLSDRIPDASYGKGKDGWVVRVPNYVGERAGGINELRRTGRAIGYQLIDKNGKTDPRKSFDLAVYWKDYLDYNELELAYDTFDPSGELTTSIILTMPKVPESFEVDFNDREGVDLELESLLGDSGRSDGYRLKTTYNGEVQTKNELLEILP